MRSSDSPLDRFFGITKRKIKGAGPGSKQFPESEKLVISVEGKCEFSVAELEARLYQLLIQRKRVCVMRLDEKSDFLWMRS
jgi:hypothetical protein